MDPKSRPFKSPDLTPLLPDFGAKLVAWVKKDMDRARAARRDRASAKAPPPRPPTSPGD